MLVYIESKTQPTMGVFDHTLKAVIDGHKNNLQEKLRGSCKFEFKAICEKLERDYGLKPSHLMGLGTSCIVYKYGADQVIKVCAKKIKYFHHHKGQTAYDFQKTVAPLAPYLLPIEKVIYDGYGFFAYIQGRCQPLPKKEPINAQNLTDLLQIIQVMFSHDILVGQMKPKNVGFWKGHLVLFDYHSMHPLYERIQTKPTWCQSLVESLACYHELFGKHTSLPQVIASIQKAKTTADITQVISQMTQLREQIKPPPPKPAVKPAVKPQAKPPAKPSVKPQVKPQVKPSVKPPTK